VEQHEEQHEEEVEVVGEAHLARREEVLPHEGEEEERCEAVGVRDHEPLPSNKGALRMAQGPFEEQEAAASARQQRALTNDHRLR